MSCEITLGEGCNRKEMPNAGETIQSRICPLKNCATSKGQFPGHGQAGQPMEWENGNSQLPWLANEVVLLPQLASLKVPNQETP